MLRGFWKGNKPLSYLENLSSMDEILDDARNGRMFILVDRLAWFRSPKLIGGDGRGAISAFGIDGIAEAPAFARDSIFDAGDDVLETYHRAT